MLFRSLKVGLVHRFLSIGEFFEYLSLGLNAAKNWGVKQCSERKNGGFFSTAGFSTLRSATGLKVTVCLQSQLQK